MTTGGRLGKKRYRLNLMPGIIDKYFEVVDKRQYGEPGPTVVVFRPKISAAGLAAKR
jgi:hypothetical protein